MPLYNSVKPIYLYPGQQLVLFDGTESPASGVKSIAFERAPTHDSLPSPMVFTVVFPSAPTATLQIQASNDDVDANYQVVQPISTQQGYYSDQGQFRYYRLDLSAYTSGGMPKVICQR